MKSIVIKLFVRIFLVASFLMTPFLLLGQTKGTPSGEAKSPDIKVENETNPVVLTLGDQKVTADELMQLMAILPPQQRQQYSGPNGPRAFAEYLAGLMALAKSAEKENLDQRPDVSAQLKFSRDQILAVAEQQAILRRIFVSDEQIQKYYDENKAQFVELHLLHISIPVSVTDPKDTEHARELLENLRQSVLKGQDFETLAKQYSKDSDAAKGGDLGFIGRGKMGTNIEDVVFKLKPGEMSPVFSVPGAVHLFEAIGERPQPLADAQEAISDILKVQTLQMSLTGIMREDQVSFNDAYFSKISGEALTLPVTIQKMKNGKPVGPPVKTTITVPHKN